jgi:hypothetical protein
LMLLVSFGFRLDVSFGFRPDGMFIGRDALGLTRKS